MPSTNLHQAIDEGSLPSAIELMDKRVNLEELQDGLTPLHHAIEKLQTEIANALIAGGANIEIICDHETPLTRAIFRGQKEVALALIKAGANLETPAKTSLGDLPPLGVAIFSYQPEIALALITAGAKVNVLVGGISYLHDAIDKKQTEIAKALIKRDANKEIICDNETPLTRAIFRGQKEIVQVLIYAGANLETPAKSVSGALPPLGVAIDLNQPEIALILIDAGADVNVLVNGESYLHIAIEKKQTKIAKALIMRRADKEIICGNLTPLIRAILNGQKEIAQELINARVNMEIPVKTNFGDLSPLGVAINKNQPEIALALIEAGAEVNVLVDGKTYLHIAIEKEQTEIAKALIARRGANIEIICDNMTPLIRAIHKGQKEIALALINARVNVEKPIKTDFGDLSLLGFAIDRKQPEIALALINARVNLEIPIKTDLGDLPPLGFAMINDQSEVAVALIAAGADANGFVNETPYLHIAIDKQQTKIANALIKRGANTDIIFGNVTPLIRAIIKGQKEIALALINARANVEIPQNTDLGDISPLGIAIDHRQPEIALALIKAGADINIPIKTIFGDMPSLGLAIFRNQSKVALALIAAGADVNVLVDGKSYLHDAIEDQQTDVANALIARGANKEIIYDNMTPLILAISRNQTLIALDLIEAGANVEAQCNEHTALQIAVEAANSRVIEALIKNGANLAVKFEGYSLLDFALMTGNIWIIRLIVDSGVKEISDEHRQKMSDLHYAIILGDEALVNAALQKNNNKDITYMGMFPLEMSLCLGRYKIAEMLIDAGLKKEIPFEELCVNSDGCPLSLLTSLLPHAQIFNIPLSSIMNHDFFNSEDNIVELLNVCSNGATFFDYVVKYQLFSQTKLYCLEILDLANRVKKLDDARRKAIADVDENAGADEAVFQANQHYRKTIVPYIAEHYRTVSLEETEKEIRELILKEIAKECEDYCKNNVDNLEECNRKNLIKEFIEDNCNDLIEGESSALEASATLIVDNTCPQAAWRCYNPFAKVSGKWANLLTPSEKDVEIFSTRAAHEGKLSEKEGSLIVRTRVAHYFRFVVDENDGDVPNKIANFLIQLSEMRNAHGLNDSSCFPGYLTRIAKMGAFHSVGKLSCDFVEFLHDHFRTKVLQQFKEEYNSETTLEEKCDLLASLTDLNETLARDIILGKRDYAESLCVSRLNFIKKLGSVHANFEELANNPQAILFYENSEVYILQYLVDVSRNEIGTMLADYHRRALDRAPTRDELNAANPFNESEENEHAIFDLIFAQIPFSHSIRTKYSAFENMRDVLKAKVPLMLKEKNQVENIVTEIFNEELSEDKVTKMIALIKALPFMQPSTEPVMTSRFVHEIALLRKNHSTMPASIQNRLKSLEQKNALFEDVFPKVKAAFMENDAFCKEFAECLAIHLFLHECFTMESFCEDEKGNFANEYQHYFTAESEKLCALEEMLNPKKVSSTMADSPIAIRQLTA